MRDADRKILLDRGWETATFLSRDVPSGLAGWSARAFAPDTFEFHLVLKITIHSSEGFVLSSLHSNPNAQLELARYVQAIMVAWLRASAKLRW